MQFNAQPFDLGSAATRLLYCASAEFLIIGLLKKNKKTYHEIRV